MSAPRRRKPAKKPIIVEPQKDAVQYRTEWDVKLPFVSRLKMLLGGPTKAVSELILVDGVEKFPGQLSITTKWPWQ